VPEFVGDRSRRAGCQMRAVTLHEPTCRTKLFEKASVDRQRAGRRVGGVESEGHDLRDLARVGGSPQRDCRLEAPAVLFAGITCVTISVLTIPGQTATARNFCGP
jgi:hypothetical protein